MGVNNISRIPSLDGLRAISILLVVIGHAYKVKIIDIANLGVRVFFVISAYLIVGILLNDVQKNRFSIKIFYFKRLMRTFPAFYFYLIVLFIFLSVVHLFDWEQFWRAPIYLENYHPRYLWNEKQWFVGHTWSLAVEEQFYLLIAFVFYFLSQKKISKKQVLLIQVFVFLLVPFIRIGYMYFSFFPDVLRGSIHRSFETVADALAIGGILAMIPKKKLLNNKWILFFKNKTWLLSIIIFSIPLCNSSLIVKEFGLRIRYFYNLIGLPILHISLGLLLFIVVHFSKDSKFSKFLNYPYIVQVGLWSYSIYLWQQVWLFSWKFPTEIKLLGIIITALMSYYFIEKPFLNWRDKLLKNKWIEKN